MDANGAYDKSVFDSIHKGDFFKGVEFGWSKSGAGDAGFLMDNVHVALWHRDAIDQPNSESAWGAAFTTFWWFDKKRIGTAFRAGWSDDNAGTLNQKAVSATLVANFTDRDDLFGIGVSWGRPVDSDEDQWATEMFYRWQLARNLAITPDVQVLFNPPNNPKDDVVGVFGLRMRMTF